jgi:hypothetical protein
MPLRLSIPEHEGRFEAAKWLKIPMLIDGDECQALLEELGDVLLAPLGQLVIREEAEWKASQLVKEVGKWVFALQEGREVEPRLALALSREPEALWMHEVRPERYLIKVSRPVVIVQPHYFTYSALDGEIRSMSMGPGAIFWGMQFSFPQVYQVDRDVDSGGLVEVEEGELFRQIRRWAREATRPTPFLLPPDGRRVNHPMRIGKRCMGWVSRHPGLLREGLHVVESGS